MTANRSQALATITTNPQSTQPLMLAANLPTAYVGTPWIGTVWGVGGAGGNVYSGITVPAWATASTVTILGIPIVQITGTPTSGTLGSNPVTVTVTDSSTTATTKQFRFNVTYSISGTGGQLSANAVPPPAYTSNPYSLDLKTYLNNPTLPLTSTVLTTGTLPTGMTLHSATGIVDASSVTGITQNCVFTITDGAGAVAVLHLQLRVKPGLSATTYAPPAVIGQPYKGKVTVSGGSGSYSVQAVAANPLPAGLAVSKYGDITGQATALTPSTGAPTTHFQITDLVTGESITTTALGGGSKSIVVGSSIAPAAPGRFVTTANDGSSTTVDYLAQFFGDGSDGDVTISSGTTTLTRDMYYATLTLSGTGKVNAAGHDIYCATLLDLTNAGASAIYCSASSALPGTVSATGAPYGTNGGVAVAGGVSAGTTGNAGAALVVGVSGGAQGGSGGAGNPGTGGGVAAATFPTVQPPIPRNVLAQCIFQVYPGLAAGISANDAVPIGGGCGGGSGGGGGGNGSLAGAQSGAGGGGGGRLRIAARNIARGASTAAGCIDVGGFKGDVGLNGPGTNRGAGGAGAGGGGGFADITHAGLTGTTASNAIDASGGGGNNGGTSGGSGSTQGTGGDGGPGGAIAVRDMLAGTVSISLGTSGTAHSGRIGGAGNAFAVSL